MLTKGGSPVSFVEYQDTSHAAVAMAMLQGFVLCPDRGGIRIEYAKTKMVDNGELKTLDRVGDLWRMLELGISAGKPSF